MSPLAYVATATFFINSVPNLGEVVPGRGKSSFPWSSMAYHPHNKGTFVGSMRLRRGPRPVWRRAWLSDPRAPGWSCEQRAGLNSPGTSLEEETGDMGSVPDKDVLFEKKGPFRRSVRHVPHCVPAASGPHMEKWLERHGPPLVFTEFKEKPLSVLGSACSLF